MKKMQRRVIPALLLAACFIHPVRAEPQPVSVRLGYVNMDILKRTIQQTQFPDTLEKLSQIKKDITQRLQRRDQCPRDSVDWTTADDYILKEERQRDVLFRFYDGLALTAVVIGIRRVSNEKTVEVVVDESSIFFGAELMLGQGEDLTEAVLNKIMPHATNENMQP